MKTFKRTILIDLDGVLNQYTGNFEKDYIPPIKEGAKEFLKNLSNNFELKLFTTRNKILASKWLIENAHKYGFVIRYPADKVDETGISYEPWHYRYVGEEVAEIIYKKDLSLEGFVQKYQKN